MKNTVHRLPKHLRELEAESIEIMREVAAEFNKPVMLYSIGKDSSVMLHLAIKAFYPSRLPFPLLHIDTRWKFREMITFRDDTARRLDLKLIVYVNPEGQARGIDPLSSGSVLYTQVMKTEALKQAIDLYGFDAAFGGARRDEEKSRAKERISPFDQPNISEIRAISDPNFGISSMLDSEPVRQCGCSRYRTGPNSIFGNTFCTNEFRWFRSILLGNGLSCGATSAR